MKRTTHIAVGIAATLPLFSVCPLYSFLGIVGATLPDIDIRLGIKHRTITHSLLMLFISTLLFALININVGFILGLNYLIHLLLDSCTKMGVPFFYPFNKKCYGFKFLKTGDQMDYLISLLAIYFIFSYL